MNLEHSSEKSRQEDEVAIAYLRSKWGEEKFNQFYNNLDLDELLRYNDLDYLKLAIEQARKSVKMGGFPAGAVVVKDGKVIAEGVSTGYLDNDPTGHAETEAIRLACKNLKTVDLEGATLYESLECCLMCFSVANWANVKRIVFAARKTPGMVKKFYYEGITGNKVINEQNNKKIELVFIPDLEEESLKFVKEWEKR